jgi:O-antigen/teichoic acid export membrane protein
VSADPISSPAPLSPGRAEHAGAAAPEEHVRALEWGVALRNGLKMGGSLLITWSVALIVKLRVPTYLGVVRGGHFAFAESFASSFFAVLGLGVDVHLMKEVAVRPKYASEVVGGVIVLRLLLTLLIFPAMAIVLLRTGRSGEILSAVMIFGASQHLMALNATLGAVLQANSRVGPAVIANIATKMIWGVGLLIGMRLHASMPVLVLPVLVGEALRAAILIPATRSGGLHFRMDVPALREAVRESVPYFINGLALTILSNLVMNVLEYVKSDEREVGWFAVVQNLGSLCMMLSPVLFWVVVPLLARAYARSEEEGMAVFQRCLEGLVVAIAPITVLISAGSDFLIRAVYHEAYVPAATGLSILSLVFIMTYTNMMLANNLTVLRQGWSVTIISISSIFVMSALMLVFVPLGRRLLGEGGECAGAASSVIASEACTLVAMLARHRRFPLDRRNLRVFAKIAALSAFTLILNRQLRFLGPIRLLIDAGVYTGIALAIGIVRIRDIGHVVRLLRHRGGEPGADAPSVIGAEG